MEPVSAAHAIRPASAAGGSDAGAVLKDGRILAAEVLQAHDDGRLMLALGRHRVPAETNLRLDEGQQFLVRVDGEGAAAVLRVLGAGDPMVAQLLAALRRVVGEDRPIGALLQDLAATLRAESARPGGALGDLGHLIASIDAQALDPGGGGEALRSALATTGLRYEALLALATRGRVGAELLDGLRANFKAELLAAFEQAQEGPVKTELARVLSALEAEQLLNVARRSAGEPLVWSFPFPDQTGWTTAHLLLSQGDERGADDGGANGSGSGEASELTLAIHFTRLGAIRADVSLGPDTLSARLLVESEELAARVRADAEELGRRLSDGRRSVHVFARVARAAEELDVETRPLDIRFLREHHLMDVEG